MRGSAVTYSVLTLLFSFSPTRACRAEDLPGPGSICFECSWNIAEHFRFPDDCRDAAWARYLTGCRGACIAEDETATQTAIRNQAQACLDFILNQEIRQQTRDFEDVVQGLRSNRIP